jgi:hypothetical protein
VANNPLKSLPAEFAALPTLRKLITEGCAFEEEYSFELKHDPPSLFEQCARQVAQSHTEIPNQLAEHIKDYLLTAQTCSYCKGPFFDSHVTRTRFIDRVGQVIAFDYKLCCSHWTDENDRIHAMFSTQPTQPGRNHKIDTEGLSDSIMKTNQRIRSNSNSSIGSNSSKEDAIPLYRLKSLPDLPPLQHSHTLPGPSHTPKNGYNRPRASSGASVTKRLTNFISRTSSSTLKERSHSSINLSAHLTSNGSSSNLA